MQQIAEKIYTPVVNILHYSLINNQFYFFSSAISPAQYNQILLFQFKKFFNSTIVKQAHLLIHTIYLLLISAFNEDISITAF